MTVADLRYECEKNGIKWEPSWRQEDLEIALRDHYCRDKDILRQLPVMLARDLKDTWAGSDTIPPWRSPATMRYWTSPRLVAELKYDGLRFKMHFTTWEDDRTGDVYPSIRLDSRRRSVQDYAYAEKTDNFPQFTYPGYFLGKEPSEEYQRTVLSLNGTVLDGEIIMEADNIDSRRYGTGKGVVTEGELYSTMVVANSGPETALAIQRDYGPAIYIAFDVLFVGKNDVRRFPFSKRRVLLEQIVKKLNNPYIRLSRLVRNEPGDHSDEPATLRFFENVIAQGKEGVMLKDLTWPYEPDKRSKGMLKVKRFETEDGVVVGFRPGDHGFTGLVGALEVSKPNDAGRLVPLAAVSSFPLALRHEMTSLDGTLKPEYYGRWVEVRFQQKQEKSGRGRHAQLVRWRDDIPRMEIK